MNLFKNARQISLRSQLCLLGLLALTLFSSPVAAQVFDSGPSDPALFDTVMNVPTDPDIPIGSSSGDDGLTTQVNISDGGSIGSFFNALSGSEINISGGSIGNAFLVSAGSEVNLFGSDFVLFLTVSHRMIA